MYEFVFVFVECMSRHISINIDSSVKSAHFINTWAMYVAPLKRYGCLCKDEF